MFILVSPHCNTHAYALCMHTLLKLVSHIGSRFIFLHLQLNEVNYIIVVQKLFW